MSCFIFCNGCTNSESSEELNKAKSIQFREIREYKGQKVSSINDFTENSIKGPQYIDKKSYILRITGLVEKPQNYTYDKLISKYQHSKKMITLNCVEGWSVTILWEGILVRELIKDSKPLPKAKVIIFHAHDGYTTSFPINYIMDNNIIMAYKMNEIVIPPNRGFPFQLIAEDKWGYKWIKWITEIELSGDNDYKGYWESRGYSNYGDLNKNFFE